MGQRGNAAASPNERRFAVVGEFVRDELPPNAILLSMQHSGSVRYYSGRLTLRWDLLPPEWLERSSDVPSDERISPVAAARRVGAASVHANDLPRTRKLGALDWQPVATYSGEIRTDIFDPADQGRVAGRPDDCGRSPIRRRDSGYRVITYVAPAEMPKLGSRSVMPASTPKSSRNIA